MSKRTKTPAELRRIFGDNLKLLSERHRSVTELARQLGINRTQFNRYISGESFPRPDVLAKICNFFDVDARILLEPVDEIAPRSGPTQEAFIRDFMGASSARIPEEMFPNGFYRFARRSFVRHDLFIVGIVLVKRQGEHTFLRGYESKEAMDIQGLPVEPAAREFRGIAMQQEDGITLLVSRRNMMTGSFNYLNRVASFDNNFWVGYVTRTAADQARGIRATRLVYEYLGDALSAGIRAYRHTGFISEDELLPFHRRLLRPEVPFY
ncbi:MAG: helix-turn-helix transcriptional regulator [Pseudomonadota bacterium]